MVKSFKLVVRNLQLLGRCSNVYVVIGYVYVSS